MVNIKVGGEWDKKLIFGPLGLELRPKTRKTFFLEKIKKRIAKNV